MNWLTAKRLYFEEYKRMPYFGQQPRLPIHSQLPCPDLSRYHISKDLSRVDGANLVIVRIKYTGDREVYNEAEYWLRSNEEMYQLFRKKRDDCDGVAQMTVAIHNWCGYPRSALCVGWYGDNPGKRDVVNHAWDIYPLPDATEFELYETTGDVELGPVPLMSDVGSYHPRIAADTQGTYYVWDKTGTLVSG